MNRTLLLATLFLLGGCTIQKTYLPSIKETPSSPYGTFIKVYTVNKESHAGEFLALENEKLVILGKNEPYLQYVDTAMVKSYFIQYCNMKLYGILPVLALSHGFFMIITVPVNLITAAALKSREMKDSRFHDMPYYQASAYARYPQGLPPGFSLR